MIGIVDLALVIVFGVVYLWVFYNVPIIAAGVKSALKSKRISPKQNLAENRLLPSFSVIVPVKNEGKLVGRLFEALQKLNYPKEKIEIIVVEDGSSDNTFDVCRLFANKHDNVKVLQRQFSDGKPSALNYALKYVKNDVVAVFDADNVPAVDSFLNAARYFDDKSVVALQGRTLSINSKENMLTQFISYEEAIWCEAYLRGKDALGLFVHLKGSCQFIRRSTLEKLSGFDESTLSEDMEISARITENGYCIKYGGDVCAWQESPSTLKSLFKQRTRWYRGTMEVAFKYGRLLAKPSIRNLDAEATLYAPFIIIASLLSYLVGSGIFFVEAPFNIIWTGFMYFSLLSTTAMALLAGVALIFVSKPRRASNVLWLPFVFAYWGLQAFVALYAALLIVFRRPKKWVKTEKTGNVADIAFVVQQELKVTAQK
jgi:cellulose synthase/poly-beta-1,6-N-acetylglucosamine synthase-like glycosyltransferase